MQACLAIANGAIGTGIHTSNPALEEQSANTVTCYKCGVHLGFSFTKPWHERPSQYSYSYDHPANSPCASVKPAGQCWVCNGTGKGTRYLSDYAKGKKRKSAIAELERQGWKVWYERHSQCWMMERETVVKDWGQTVDVTA